MTLPESDTISDGEYYYIKHEDRVVAYIEDVDMYLIVTNSQHVVTRIMPYIEIPLICVSIGILASLALMGYAEYLNRKDRKPAA